MQGNMLGEPVARRPPKIADAAGCPRSIAPRH